jgi:esterase/lipase
MKKRWAVAGAGSLRSQDGSVLRIARIVIIVLLAVVVVLCGVGTFVTYSVISTRNETENVSPGTYLLSSYETVNFTDRHGGEHEGWLLVGLKGAPVVIFCHNYNSNRSELLSLGTAIWDNHFNVYIYNDQGPKSKHRLTDFGRRSAEDLQDAILAITKYANINTHRVGVYGTGLGAYAALLAAEKNPMVQVVVADSVYDTPDEMFQYQVNRTLGGSSALFRFLCTQEFHLFNFWAAATPLSRNLATLDRTSKLLIAGEDAPTIAASTRQIYNAAPQPKKLVVLEHSFSSMISGTERSEYETQVMTFFLQNLSLRTD